MFVITKKFRFEAAHKLPHHEGACKNLHGHSYVLEVSLVSEQLQDGGPAKGMMVDFGDLKSVVNPIVDRYDHCCLNDHFENPTAEIMVRNIAEEIQKELGVPMEIYRVFKVRLYETVNSWAEWVE
mgnify:CR=1 FL=1|tara:strand:- start:38475 stop:38849 length:375 start_codon:yes stop_codon:yes gene_type:complete